MAHPLEDVAYQAMLPHVSAAAQARCRTLRDLLTVVREDLPEPVIEAVEAAIRASREHLRIVDADTLPYLPAVRDISVCVFAPTLILRSLQPFNRIAVWRGDCTTLRVDAIVNAANSAMLGCFTLGHRSIDNVIQEAAGPRLRMACRVIMQAQGHAEPTGQAKITPAFCLPSRFVLHTVGPIYDVAVDQSALLARSYTSCLDAALAAGLSSVAVCCISTGVFGYPQEEAARVAITAVLQWLEAHRDADMRVIFNTFTERDTHIYETSPLLQSTEH